MIAVSTTLVGRVAAGALAAVLAACGGGGGGGAGGGGNPSTPTPNPSPTTLQGLVTGLAGRDFAVQNQGVVVPVAADGSFGFSGIANGARYHVTVASQPMAPSQTCSIANGAGIFTGAIVSNVRISCSNDELAVLAGRIGGRGARDDEGTAARLSGPLGAAVDAAGNVYVTDLWRIRRVSPLGVVTTLAGGADPGHVDGPAETARFALGIGIAVDAGGNVFVADTLNHAIRRIAADGTVATFAGNPAVAGSEDGTGNGATFGEPSGIALDSAGNLYVADRANHTIRKITPSRVVTTLAGVAYAAGSADGVGTTARFDSPQGVAVDGVGNVYVADSRNHTIRRIATTGEVTTLAGAAGVPGNVNAAGSAARLDVPNGIAVGNGTLFVTENGAGQGRLRAVNLSTGAVTYVAGGGLPGGADGVGLNANFGAFAGVAVAADGTVYVADWEWGTLRKVVGDVVTTLAGARARPGTSDGEPWAARFSFPSGLASAPDGTLYVADRGKIRVVSPAGRVTTLTGSTELGAADGSALDARFGGSGRVAMAANGTLFVADIVNHTVRAIAADGSVTTLAGLAGTPGYADGVGSSARFEFLTGIAVDPAGNVYVSEGNRRIVRKITPGGVVTTFAGAPDSTICCADGIGPNARFALPHALATDSSGFIYVTDVSARTLRRISPAGEVVTLAGGNPDSVADGVGSAAGFRFPSGVTVDASANVFVVDGSRIRKVTPAGLVTTIAGVFGSAGVRPGPLPGSLNAPTGIAVWSPAPLTLAVTDENAILLVPVRP